MDKKSAFIFPGQGAQYVAMGKDFYENYAVAKQTFELADELLGFPMTRIIFEGPREELTLTKNSQSAIYVTSVAILRVLKQEFPELSPAICAGLSLGEYTALTAAGILPFEEGLQLVRMRGELMHQASISHPGTMVAVLGLEEKNVADTIKQAGLLEEVWIANLNCPRQVVISGSDSGIQQSMPALKSAGARRILPLNVAGAFHSGLMLDAEEGLAASISRTKFVESDIQIAMNVSGCLTSSLNEIKQNLLQQLTSPVRWQKSIEVMVSAGIETFYEIGPGKILQGMNKKIGLQKTTVSLENAEDFEKLMIER
jgi:[acyl-carrier-protein] S-malonyltransferase